MLRVVSQGTLSLEPVTLAEAKAAAFIDGTDSDSYVTTLISAARAAIERQCGLALIERPVVAVMDRWPDDIAPDRRYGLSRGYARGLSGSFGDWSGTREGAIASLTPFGVVEIARPRPVSAVTKIETADAAGTFTTVPSSSYSVDLSDNLARVSLMPGASWPTPQISTGGIRVSYTAGFGDTAAEVPPELRLAVMTLVKFWFDTRDPMAASTVASLPNHLDAILGSWSAKRL